MENEVFDINYTRALIFEDEEGRLTLSPRACLISALQDAGIIDTSIDIVTVNDDYAFNGAYLALINVFEEEGYIESVKKPGFFKRLFRKKCPTLFCEVIKMFYPQASYFETVGAWHAFYRYMKLHGNIK